MPLNIQAHQQTLPQFLSTLEPAGTSDWGDISAIVMNASRACKTISLGIAYGALGGVTGDYQAEAGQSINVQGETQKKLDVLSNNMFIHCTESGGQLAGMASEELTLPHQIPAPLQRGRFLLLFDPLDGSSNIDINTSVGTIFSILRCPESHVDGDVSEADFLQEGHAQVGAGYAIYGPSTMLVLALGQDVNGFTLDPRMGEFVLTHPSMRIATETQEFAINASNSRFWEAPISRYVDECLAGKSGARGKDFNMRWIGSLVAETHRILMRGGVFIYPRDTKDLSKPGRLRLLYETNPIGLVVEWAGGRASTGEMPMLQATAKSLHQRIGFVFGSRSEVERIERYHATISAAEPSL